MHIQQLVGSGAKLQPLSILEHSGPEKHTRFQAGEKVDIDQVLDYDNCPFPKGLENLSPTFTMEHLLHCSYGVDAPGYR